MYTKKKISIKNKSNKSLSKNQKKKFIGIRTEKKIVNISLLNYLKCNKINLIKNKVFKTNVIRSILSAIFYGLSSILIICVNKILLSILK